ncbi:MAG: hypothetical protein QF441_09920 [Bacteriovoracaceae bacterium]|jgi:hypothetical protein|nr:hypothetical protein [Bacteriovoracaceae bacterium]
MLNSLYFCENCRQLVADVSQLHFVEENSDRGFCCENCIMEFYRPFLLAFENEEELLRDKLNLFDEDYDDQLSEEGLLDRVLMQPDERWLDTNELGQKFYTHILRLNKEGIAFYFIAICSYIESGPSFVYYRLATKHEGLLQKYKRGEKLDAQVSLEASEEDSVKDITIEPEVIDLLESKKSLLLAWLMEIRSEVDIEFEQFHLYDKYLSETIETPDEVYEYEDEAGDTLNNYIKSFKIDKTEFFYVVIAYPYEIAAENKMAILPILSFPSIDKSLYPHVTLGKKLTHALKN